MEAVGKAVNSFASNSVALESGEAVKGILVQTGRVFGDLPAAASRGVGALKAANIVQLKEKGISESIKTLQGEDNKLRALATAHLTNRVVLNLCNAGNFIIGMAEMMGKKDWTFPSWATPAIILNKVSMGIHHVTSYLEGSKFLSSFDEAKSPQKKLEYLKSLLPITDIEAGIDPAAKEWLAVATSRKTAALIEETLNKHARVLNGAGTEEEIKAARRDLTKIRNQVENAQLTRKTDILSTAAYIAKVGAMVYAPQHKMIPLVLTLMSSFAGVVKACYDAGYFGNNPEKQELQYRGVDNV